MPAKIASQKSSTSASASWRKSSKKVGSSTARGKDGGTSRRRRLGSGSLNRDVEKDKGDGEDDNGGESSDDDVGDEIEGAADAADAASGDSVEQGSRLRQFTMGDFKLSMWIPSDLGTGHL